VSARTGPDGRGTLRALSPPLKEPCPRVDEPEYDALEFSDEDDRTLPAGGRGTDRFIAICEEPARPPEVDSGLDVLALGGRGTDRSAAEDGPPPKPLPADGFAMLSREPTFCTLRMPGPFDGARDAEMPDVRAFPPIPILLTTGRLNVRELGAAARIPAVRPNIASRVGFALTRFKDGALRIAFCDTCTEFRFTANPCSKVFRDTAVNPPRAFMFA
jgi:hypothetical protein